MMLMKLQVEAKQLPAGLLFPEASTWFLVLESLVPPRFRATLPSSVGAEGQAPSACLVGPLLLRISAQRILRGEIEDQSQVEDRELCHSIALQLMTGMVSQTQKVEEGRLEEDHWRTG